MKILFVEDDQSVSNLAKLIFMKTSHDVIICPNPDDAMRLMELENFDLIVLDMNFSSGTGGDVLSFMSKHEIRTPVVIYSGMVERYESIIQHYTEAGIVKMVCRKPTITPANIAKIMHGLV